MCEKTRGELKEIARNLSVAVAAYVRSNGIVGSVMQTGNLVKDAEFLYQSLRDDLKLTDEENKYIDKKFATYMLMGAKEERIREVVVKEVDGYLR
jgi:hypothetical protein